MSDESEEDVEDPLVYQIIEIPLGDEIVQDIEWDLSERPEQDKGKDKISGEGHGRRKRPERTDNRENKRRKIDSSDEEDHFFDDQEPQDVSVDLIDLEKEDELNSDSGKSDVQDEGEGEMEEAKQVDRKADYEARNQIASLRQELEQIGQEGKAVLSDHPALEVLLTHHEVRRFRLQNFMCTHLRTAA